MLLKRHNNQGRSGQATEVAGDKVSFATFTQAAVYWPEKVIASLCKYAQLIPSVVLLLL